MDAVLYYKDNGFGLTQDAKVVASILQKIGIQPIHREPTAPIKADLSIHFEIPSLGGIKLSDKSVFFPNFEWFFFDTGIMARFDVIACKTRQAVPIARQFSKNVVYTGFISEDMRANQSERTLEFYHIAGQSRLKNTQNVVECWRQNPGFPRLHLYTNVHTFEKLPENVVYTFRRAERQEIKNTMNQYLVAVQPSATEGFGQVLWESLSTGSILITTAAEPMQEIPANFYVPGYQYGHHNFHKVYEINPQELAQTVEKILKLKGMELVMASTTSRQAWVSNTNAFIERFMGVI